MSSKDKDIKEEKKENKNKKEKPSGNKTKTSKKEIGDLMYSSVNEENRMENGDSVYEETEEEDEEQEKEVSKKKIKDRFKLWKEKYFEDSKEISEESRLLNQYEADPSQSKFWEEEFKLLAISSCKTWEARNKIEAIILLKDTVKKLVKLYLESLDINEYQHCINELDYRIGFHLVAKVMLSISLDENEKNQTLIFSLLKSCIEQEEGVLTLGHVLQAYRQLVVHVDDIELDVPNARVLSEHGVIRGFLPIEASSITRIVTMTKQQLQDNIKKIENMLDEYFLNELLEEFIRGIDDLDHEELHHEIIKSGILMSINKTGRERQLMSILIATLAGDIVERPVIELAFELLAESVEDEIIDSPNFISYLAAFIARAVSDEALAPIWMDRLNLHPSDLGYEVVNQAQILLAGGFGNPARLMHIWGKHSNRAVAELKTDVLDLLSEYFVNELVDEALQCISELNAKYFHHEIVFKAFVIALDGGDKSIALFNKLIHELFKSHPESSQIISGFHRIGFQLKDLALDAPQAPAVFEQVVALAKKIEVLPSDFNY